MYLTISISAILMIVFAINMSMNNAIILTAMRQNLLFKNILFTFFHGNFEHLLMNLLGLFRFYRIEIRIGSLFIFQTFYLIFCNALFTSIAQYFGLIRNEIIGYSGVIFGLLTLYPTNNIFGYYCDPLYSVFVLVFIIQVLSIIEGGRVSFKGHMIGIISAYIFKKLILRN